MISVMNPTEPFQQRQGGEPEDWQVYSELPMSTMSSRSTALDACSPPYSVALNQHIMSSVNPIWPDTQAGFFCGHVSSPSLPSAFDEAEFQVPQSNNVSGAATPSASSSTAASPQSHHGQLASMGEWPANPGGLSVAGQDFYAGTEYQTFGPGMDELQQQQYELQLKGPFGESQTVATSQKLSTSSPASMAVPTEPEPGLESTLVSTVSSAPPSSRRTSFSSTPSTPTSDFSSFTRMNCVHFSPFFHQSSGHFVPPLESSCWFPLFMVVRLGRQ